MFESINKREKKIIYVEWSEKKKKIEILLTRGLQMQMQANSKFADTITKYDFTERERVGLYIAM